jgi:hypothetical protein
MPKNLAQVLLCSPFWYSLAFVVLRGIKLFVAAKGFLTDQLETNEPRNRPVGLSRSTKSPLTLQISHYAELTKAEA